MCLVYNDTVLGTYMVLHGIHGISCANEWYYMVYMVLVVQANENHQLCTDTLLCILDMYIIQPHIDYRPSQVTT